MEFKLDAAKIVNEGHRYLASIKWVASAMGLPILEKVMAFAINASDTQEERDQLIKWLRWTPLFTAKEGEPAESPELPAKYESLRELGNELKENDAIEFV